MPQREKWVSSPRASAAAVLNTLHGDSCFIFCVASRRRKVTSCALCVDDGKGIRTSVVGHGRQAGGRMFEYVRQFPGRGIPQDSRDITNDVAPTVICTLLLVFLCGSASECTKIALCHFARTSAMHYGEHVTC